VEIVGGLELRGKGVVRERLANPKDGLGLSVSVETGAGAVTQVLPDITRGVARVGLSAVSVIAGAPAGVMLSDPSDELVVMDSSRGRRPRRECGNVWLSGMIGSSSGSNSRSSSSDMLWDEIELGGEVVNADTGDDADRCISGRTLGGVVSFRAKSSSGKSSHVKDRQRCSREGGRGKDDDGNGKPGLRVVALKLKVNARAAVNVNADSPTIDERRHTRRQTTA